KETTPMAWGSVRGMLMGLALAFAFHAAASAREGSSVLPDADALRFALWLTGDYDAGFEAKPSRKELQELLKAFRARSGLPGGGGEAGRGRRRARRGGAARGGSPRGAGAGNRRRQKHHGAGPAGVAAGVEPQRRRPAACQRRRQGSVDHILQAGRAAGPGQA